MKLNTMAAVMSLVTQMESDAASFYEGQGAKHPELKETFLAWAKENLKFEKMVKQTYFGVITDTLEACYAFEGLDSDDYVLNMRMPKGAGIAQVKKTASGIETRMKNFYAAAGAVSDGLMADIPRLFKKIAGKRENRERFLAN